jgi:hypothetical protein
MSRADSVFRYGWIQESSGLYLSWVLWLSYRVIIEKEEKELEIRLMSGCQHLVFSCFEDCEWGCACQGLLSSLLW